MPAAKAWIKANPDSHTQPWDAKGYKMPGGTPSSPGLAAILPSFPALLRKQLKGAPMPAPRKILDAAVEGAQVDFDTASRIESRYFTELVTGQVAKNMIQAFFFDLQTITGGGSRPDGIGKTPINKIGVLGAGMMGAGIAYVSAKAGYDVVLKDVSIEAAQKGKGYSEKLEAKALERGKTTEEKSKALLDRITPTADAADFKGVDFVIEAVFESSRTQAQGVPGDRGHRRAQRAARVEHVHAADHRSGDRREAAGGLHRDPLLLAGRQDAAGGNHQGREDI